MSNKIEYVLNYREKGKKKQHTFKIDFMSNRCHSNFEEQKSYMIDIIVKLDRMKELAAENELLKSDKKNKEKIADNISKIEYIKSLVDPKEAMDFLQERFKTLKTVLVDNGYDGKFLEYDFWDNCTEPIDSILFLNECHDKDNPKKKAVQI